MENIKTMESMPDKAEVKKPLRRLNQAELTEILNQHDAWWRSYSTGKDGVRADLSYVDLSGIDLSGKNISGVIFKGANLREANFGYSCLHGVDFMSADLRGANFCNAVINETTNFSGAIIDETTKFLNDQCPKTGSFIGYKKARGLSSSNYNQEYVIELEILEEAKRSSATTKKCRCSKAKVLSITNLDGTSANVLKVQSWRDSNFVYRVGEIVEVPDFNKDWRKECTTGIHFFMNREDAAKYDFC